LLKEVPRTNLFILDKDLWIKAKAKAESLGYESVSEYIFNLLKIDDERKTSLHSLLIELEKYYEFEHYTLSLVAEKIGLPIHVTINQIKELKLVFPEEKSDRNLKEIHSLMVDNKIIPREVENILLLKNKFAKKNILEDGDMLEILFRDENERTAEVMAVARSIFMEQMDNKFKIACFGCKKSDSECEYSNLRALFGRLALDYDLDAINEDPVYKILLEKKVPFYYGALIDFSASHVIERELNRIKLFELGEIYRIDEETFNKINSISKSHKKKVEKMSYIYGFTKETLISP
jgi:hypothetical protein